MNPIDETFLMKRRKGEKALIPFLTGGFPNLKLCREISLELARRGADILEIGVPFSDPIADGPIIQSSSQRALAGGANLKAILDLTQEINGHCCISVVLMSYYNPLFRWGTADFAQAAKRAGVDGLIIPDLPPEEGKDLRRACERFDLDLIFLVSPTSKEKRIRLISEASKGYIYYVSVTGTTGTRKSLASDLKPALSRLREFTSMPIAVGFGISTPPQAQAVSRVADGVIVGSALIANIQKNLGRADLIAGVGEFISRFKQCLVPSPPDRR